MEINNRTVRLLSQTNNFTDENENVSSSIDDEKNTSSDEDIENKATVRRLSLFDT